MKNTTTILDIPVTTLSEGELVTKVEKFLSEKSSKQGSLTITSINPEQIMYAKKDENFKKYLQEASIGLPDGAGVVWASKVLSEKGKVQSDPLSLKASAGQVGKRIAGVDFMEELVHVSSEKGYTVGFIGGSGDNAEKALEMLQKQHSGLQGWAEKGPEVQIRNSKLEIRNIDSDAYFKLIAKKIVDTKTRMVFVGLGAPKQEYFIKNLTLHSTLRTSHLVFMSVGGAFEFFSGSLRRAPKVIQTLHVEWLWRLGHEPSRFRRQLALVKFVATVLKERK